MDVKTKVLFLFILASIDAHILKHHIVLRNAEDAQVDDSKIDDEWWKTAIFYQIYPRSFMDSNGDGTGDLQGIISRLDHLKDMGITAAWLSPIYKSPGVDQGYDISDYTSIDPLFGNMTDLKTLVDKAHELGIKIIMDFVPNHTSDKHEWFLKSIENNTDYADFYVWRDGVNNGAPNNWLSLFGGSAWTYNEKRNKYYLHQFASAQPDLNYRNPEVVTAIKDTLKFWLDFGVDGFRVDAVPYLFEDKDFQNEPLSGNPVSPDQYAYLKPIYTSNLDETYDMIYQFRAVVDEWTSDEKNNATYSRVMMTEAYTDTSESTVAYYGNSTTKGAHFTFNFNLITDLTSNFTVDAIIKTTNKWLSHLEKNYVSNWVLGNHDQHRFPSRLGVDNVDALNMLTAFLPGIQVTYMGEEIGMEDGNLTCEQGFDPQATKNCSDEQTFINLSRDFERTPFQWDDTVNAGFSTANKTWLPVSDKYKTNNLKAQSVKGAKTHYNVYKDLVKFRANFKNITYDALSLIKLSDNVLQIVRKTNKDEYVYIFNTGDDSEQVNIYTDEVKLKVAIASVNSQRLVGDVLSNTVSLQPHESFILQTTAEKSGTNRLISTWLLSLVSLILLVQFY